MSRVKHPLAKGLQCGDDLALFYLPWGVADYCCTLQNIIENSTGTDSFNGHGRCIRKHNLYSTVWWGVFLNYFQWVESLLVRECLRPIWYQKSLSVHKKKKKKTAVRLIGFRACRREGRSQVPCTPVACCCIGFNRAVSPCMHLHPIEKLLDAAKKKKKKSFSQDTPT